MLLIVVGHLAGKSGTPSSTLTHLGSHSVNCFILISGYFLISSKFKFERLLRIVFESIFYSFIISLIFFCFSSTSLQDLLKSAFPFAPTKYSWWFVNKYIAMILLSPFINVLCTSLNKKSYKILLISLLSISSILFSFFPFGALFCNGFSLLWFVTLYITGGYLRLHYKEKKNSTYAAGIIAGLVIHNIALCCKGVIDLGYNSLISYFLGITTFLWFKDLKISGDTIPNIVRYLSPHVFAIYLIHTQHDMSRFIGKIFTKYEGCINSEVYLYLFAIAVIIASVFIDKGRTYLFNLSGIEKLTKRISAYFDNLYNDRASIKKVA